jgi:hypothetical protein
MELPQDKKRAIILLNHSLYLPCLLFLAAIQEVTRIKIIALRQAAVREISYEKKATPGFYDNYIYTNGIKAGK